MTLWVDILDDDGRWIDGFNWPYCQVAGCKNRIKLGVSDKFCHTHSAGRAADKLIRELNREREMA